MNLSFTIPGRPISWERTKLDRGRPVTSQANRVAKKAIATWAIFGLSSSRIYGRAFTDPFHVQLDFLGALTVCDVDNLSKLILDALNGIVWADDRQVVKLLAQKYAQFPGEPRTEVKLETFTGPLIYPSML